MPSLIKYLYGKKEFLEPVVKGEISLRFSDLSHYARLENDAMRDDEMSKTFTIDKFTNTLTINGRKIDPKSITKDIELSIPTRHCYCLCLSNSKNSDELFKKFDAKICIEIKVDILIEFLTDYFGNCFKGMQVEGRDISYYGGKYLPKDATALDLVFYKTNSFKHEDEYRIALFYPEDKPGFADLEGVIIPFVNSESQHMSFKYPEKELFTQFIGETYELKA